MKTVNQNLVAIALGLGLGLSVSTANAMVTPFVYDVTRTAEFAIEGVQRMLSYVSRVQEEESKEEEQVTWEKRKDNKDAQKSSDASGDGSGDGTGDGDGGDEASGEGESSGGSSKKSDKPKKLPYESEFYQYMGGKTDCDLAKEEDDDSETEPEEDDETDETERINPMSMGSEQYLPAMADAGSAEEYIRANFFFDPDLDKVTESEKNRIEQHRYAYVETLATEVLQISQGARSAIAKDLSVLSDSKTTAGGDINQVEFMVQTKKVMAEQKAADIVLQAKLMELEAAKMLLNLSPQRVEDPSKTK